MPKRLYNKELVSTLLISDIPDLLQDIAESEDEGDVYFEFYSDGSGVIAKAGDTVFGFENLEELRKYLLQNKISTKNL